MQSSIARKIILVLFLVTFLMKAFYLDYIPLQYDGTLYGEMIAEETEELTFLPRYLGEWAPWKPGLYFIVYSFFLPLTSALFTSVEWIYRFPNLIFSLVNAFLFYLIAKRFVKQDVALSASLLFYSSYGVIYTDSRLLMETFSLLPILLSILFYTWKGMEPTKRFLGAGTFALLAALTKSVISFMIIPLALAYISRDDHKNIKNPLFLASLLSPFLGFFIFYLALDSVGLVEEVLVRDTAKFFLFDYFEDSVSNILQGLLFFFYMFWMYIAVAFRKLASSWKKYPLFSVWIVLSLIPLLSGCPMPWHFYYIAPALAFFAAVCFTSKGKMDSFSVLILTILVFSNLLVASFYFNSALSDESTEEAGGREVGMLLSGKKNVLVIGYYFPSTTVVSYKMLSERRDMGRPLDFGYIVLVIPEGDKMNKTEQMTAINEIVMEIVMDYDTEKYLFEENDFADMFQTSKFLRKKTSIENFDYVVVSPSYIELTDPCYTSIYEATNTKIYKISEEPECDNV